MKLKDIYDLAVKKGKEADPRSKERIKKVLKKEKEKFEDLNEGKKDEFDKERLKNPYADTRILNPPKKDKKIKKVLAGIDIGAIELILAQKLKVDAVIAHHPQGQSLSQLDQVMDLQADLLNQLGIPINIAESLLEKRSQEVSREVSPLNHYQIVQAAEILNLPLLSVHTPADNLVYRHVKEKIEKEDPETIKELIKTIKSIAEYKKAAKMQMGPQIFVGKPERRCGKIALTEVTGGTSGSKDVYEKISQAGVSTLVGIHMKEEYKKEAEKYHLNVVIAGHMASDSVGMNLFLKDLEKKDIKIRRCGGLISKGE